MHMYSDICMYVCMHVLMHGNVLLPFSPGEGIDSSGDE